MSRVMAISVFVLASCFLVLAASQAGAESVRTTLVQDPTGCGVIREIVPTGDASLPGESGAAVLGGVRSGEILWHRYYSDATYTTTGISKPDTSLCAGTYLNPPKQIELVPLEGDGTPDWTYAGTEFKVAASRDAEVVAGLDYQSTAQTAVLYKWTADSGTPDWSYQIDSCTVGSSKCIVVSPDGSTIAVAVTKQAPKFARVYYFDSASSTPLGYYDGAADSFARTVVISEDGAYIAFIATAYVHVVERDTGLARWSGYMGATSDPLGISGDGSYLAYGWSTMVVRQWDGSSYGLLWTASQGGYYLKCCPISSDGSTLAAGWYRSSFDKNRIQLYGLPSSTPLWTYDYQQGVGGYQDSPYDIALTADGGYIAVGSWGDQMNTNPEVHVFHHSSAVPVFTVDTPGSMFDVDIVEKSGGAYVAACGKHVHANQSGRGGDLYSIHVDPPTGLPDRLAADTLVPRLEPNVPNPFNPVTSITYSIPDALGASPVRLGVYHPSGRLVRTLVVGREGPGTHTVVWDGTDMTGRSVASGVYFYRLDAGGEALTERMVLLK